MAFNPAPNTWLANWSEDGTNITVPIATFPELTAAEADGETGDIREVVFSIADALFAKWADTDTADRPTQMTISKGVSTNVNTGIVTQTFSFRFNTEVSAQGVVAEPE